MLIKEGFIKLKSFLTIDNSFFIDADAINIFDIV